MKICTINANTGSPQAQVSGLTGTPALVPAVPVPLTAAAAAGERGLMG